MKKVVKCLTVFVFLSLFFTLTVFASIPMGSVVIGSKAYSLSYANDSSNQAEISQAVVDSGGKVYIKSFDGSWIDNGTNKSIDVNSIPSVEYKDVSGDIVNYEAYDGEDITSTNNTNTLNEGDYFYVQGITDENSKILEVKSDDINNDGIKENIILAADDTEKDIDCKENGKLLIQNSVNGKILDYATIDGLIYNRDDDKLKIVNVRNKLSKDIMLTWDNTGINSQNHTINIYEFTNNKLVSLNADEIMQDDSSQNDAHYQLNDDHTLQIESDCFAKNYNVDLSNDRCAKDFKDYSNFQFFGMGQGPFFEAVDIDNDGIFEIKKTLCLDGTCHADGLAEFNYFYKYNDTTGKWEYCSFDVTSWYPCNEIK